MQTEHKRLSEREKRMLTIMAAVALLAVMVMFVFIPLNNRLNDRKTEYHTLALEKIKIEATLAGETGIRANHKAMIEKHGWIRANYLSESLNSEVGRILTGLCEAHGLQPVSQRLSDPAPFVINESGGSGNNENTSLLTVSATMTVRGEYDNLKSLLDYVRQTDYLRVSRLSFGSPRGSFTVLDRITIGFEVTMLNDI